MQRLAWFLVISLLAGCMHGADEPPPTSASSSTSSSPIGFCSQGHYVGCDNNPDAQRMLTEFGLNQITNTSGDIIEPRVDSGLVFWLGERGIHGHLISPKDWFSFGTPGPQAVGIPRPSGCCVLYDVIPLLDFGLDNQRGDYENTTIWVWNPARNEHAQVLMPQEGAYLTSRGEFDGTWALLLNFSTQSSGNRDGWTAVNVNTGAARVLFPIAPKDNTYYGTPQVGATLSNGSVFLNFLEFHGEFIKSSRIVEYILDTGVEQEVLRINDTALTRLDSSPRYVIASGYDGDRFAWVMDRTNHTWWNVQRNPQAFAVNPVVGDDWIVYYEQVPPGEEWIGGLVGIHVPTGTRHELVPDNDDLAFAEWDTDGNYLVAEVELGFATGNAAYPGTQLYWMPLPEV